MGTNAKREVTESRLLGFELALDLLRSEVRDLALTVERLRLGHSEHTSASGMSTLDHISRGTFGKPR